MTMLPKRFHGTISHYSGFEFKEDAIFDEDDTSDAGDDDPNALVPEEHVDE